MFTNFSLLISVLSSLSIPLIFFVLYKDLKESNEFRKKQLDYLDQILKKIR